MNDMFPILAFFKYDHLPARLQEISRPLGELAVKFADMETAHPAEMAAGLRKLVEAKDCFVRAALPPNGTPIPKP